MAHTWEQRFLRILKRPEYRRDEKLHRIASNEQFGLDVGRIIRSYLDKSFTDLAYEERKAKYGRAKAETVKAIDGLQIAANLYWQRDPARAAYLQQVAADLVQEAEQADILLDTERHGRERDHGILYSARQVMEKRLGPISNETLANLINAGLEVDGKADADHPVTADDVRRNMANFLKRNRNWDPAGRTR